MPRLTLGFSPCPNDTFIFHALVHGLVSVPGIDFDVRLADVETLNEMALSGQLDVTKVSYGALPELLDRYVLLRSGGALGRGCGPLLVSRDAGLLPRLPELRIAVPGRRTTANLLLRLYAPNARPGIEMEYSSIMDAVAAGDVDAGLIIHESRFTYAEFGLVALIDLGEWWESATGYPIPLGAIVLREGLHDLREPLERAIRSSVEHAFLNPRNSADYVARHAREMAPDVIERHIQLYVNDFSKDLGSEGEAAVRDLLRRARAAGYTSNEMDPFLRESTTL